MVVKDKIFSEISTVHLNGQSIMHD